MIKIDVRSAMPAPRAGRITACILNDKSEPLALKSTLKKHEGWKDIERRQAQGEISGAYLSASADPLLWLPPSAARHQSGEELTRVLAAKALAAARERQATELVLLLDGVRDADQAAVAADGLALNDYKFTKYLKPPKKKAPEPRITLVVPDKLVAAVRSAVKTRLEICESVNGARDLINEPGSVATPAEIEKRARKVASANGLKITVLQAAELEKQGYQGLISVGRGGNVPPRMIIMSYNPKGARKDVHLGLLGKGLTFDTGGVSIKPASKMWEMKGDMSGGAAVLYGMEAVARLKPKIRVTGIIVTSQNYVDAEAIVPGDIIIGRNGKSIMVDNTDAEGRLILTDGLWRAGEEKVTHLVDFATLTGAIVRAIGTSLSGAFGNDDFADRVVESARSVGEDCWRMPLWKEYVDLLKCEVADLNNIGSKPEGGAITAALFLQEFLPEGISWTHMDIAGTFLINSPWKYFRPGATGVMVRTIARLAENMAGAK